MMLASSNFPGIDGFLNTRASIMLDVVALAMFAVVPAMTLAIFFARYRNSWTVHKRIQLVLGTVLLLAVSAFEIDMQFLTEWELRAAPSPYFDLTAKWTSPVGAMLLVHLCFAAPTAVLWVIVIAKALRNFPSPPIPGPHSRFHRTWGRVAAIGMLFTALTGLVFYYMAFVA